MILSIDFGGAVAKVLIVDGDKSEVVEVPLGFRTRPHLTVPETLRYIIKTAIGDQKPEAVYATGEIASVALKEILTEPPLDPVETLEKLELPVVVVGAGMTYVNGAAVRGTDAEEFAEEIARWLPFEIKISEIQNYFANKKLYPQTIPTTRREVSLEQAAARVRIEKAIGNRQQALEHDYVIATGGVFSKAPEPGQAVLMLLDALQPEGLFNIFLDQRQMLPALAALAVFEEEKAQRILDQDPFTFLGPTFSVSEEVSLKIDLGLPEPQELEVVLGELVLFPLETYKLAKVSFRTKSQQGEFEVEGGFCGLTIDARGDERTKMSKEWEEALCSARLFKK